MDVQCITMTFRDGNTTDSNLLEVITASQPSDPIQFEGLYEKELGQARSGSPPLYPQYQYEDLDEMEEDEGDADDDDSSESEEYSSGGGGGAALARGGARTPGVSNKEDEKSGAEEQQQQQTNTNNEDEETEADAKGSISILRIESTGPSLSIGTTSDSNKNCSGQFIYFIAYYTTIPVPVPGK